jgi:hydroxyacylglutathione hydrolase
VELKRVEQPDWLSNAYLVFDRPGGSGVIVDSNGVVEPLLEQAEADGTTITHILVTHSHHDHVAGVGEVKERVGGAPIVAHADAAAELPEGADQTIADGEKLQSGELEIEAIATPGHASGHLAYLIDGSDVITADVLFKGTVGGTMAPGASGLDDLRSSVMRLMELDPAIRVHPGHREPTTIGDEWESNPFIRVWRRLDELGEEPVTVWEREATLLLWAPDYDGGNKAWVRFSDSGEEAIVGGSQVVREGEGEGEGG